MKTLHFLADAAALAIFLYFMYLLYAWFPTLEQVIRQQ